MYRGKWYDNNGKCKLHLLFHLGQAGLDLRGPYCFLNDDFFLLSQVIIFHCLNIPKLTKLGIYVTPAEKFHNLLLSSIATIIKDSAFWLITHIYFVAHSKTLYPRIHSILLNVII